MTKSNPTKKPGKLRGTKITLAALAITATMTGWAWLTTQETALGGNDMRTVNASQTFENEQGLLLNGNTRDTYTAEPRRSRRIPNLSQLPVRGLRVIGAGATAPSDTAMNPSLAPTTNNASDTQPQSTQPQAVQRRTRSSR